MSTNFIFDEDKMHNPSGGVVQENFSLNYDELKLYIRTNQDDIWSGKIVLGSIKLANSSGGDSFNGGYQISSSYFRLVSIIGADIVMFIQYDIDDNKFTGYQYVYDDVSETCERQVLSDEQMSQMNFSVSFTAYTFS